ncbi:MAG: hypothetical protein WCB26_25000, partial [Pseudolabrys sp.]
VYPQPDGKLNRNGFLDAAKAAATAAKVDLSKFDGVVVSGFGGTDLCGWIGAMAALCAPWQRLRQPLPRPEIRCD